MQTFVKMALATLAFAAVHSALASRKAKDVAGRVVGEERRDAAYRIAFVGQSLVSFTALAAFGASLPNTTVYRVTGPVAWLIRLGQITGALQLLAGLRAVGFRRWSGLRNLAAYLAGKPMPPGPAAQGPEMAEDGRLTVDGPYRWSRHPLNFAGLPMIWLTPHMTTRRLAFNVVGTVYLALGSKHEEARLEVAYGDAYRAYVGSGVPFFWRPPGLKGAARPAAPAVPPRSPA